MQPGLLYLVSPAGNPNFGDEFIAAAWLRYLAESRPESDVWLDCPQPGLAQVLFEGLHPRLRVTNTLWRLMNDNAHLPAEELTETIRARITDLGSPSYDLGLLKLRNAESLHLLGGGYLNGNWEQHTALVHALRAVRELTSASLFATGQGLMPAISSSAGGRTLFEGFSHVSARDTASASACGVELGIDDAFLAVNSGIDEHAQPGLYISLQSDTIDDHAFDKAVHFARNRVLAAGPEVNVFYVEAIPGADRVAFDRMSDLIPEERFLPFVKIWADGLPVSSSQEWITSRFHFHLLASAAGARGTALMMKEGYYDVKHESLKALGSGWQVRSPSDEGQAAPQAGALHGRAPELLRQKRSEAASLYGAPSPSLDRAKGVGTVRATLAAGLRSKLKR